MNGRKTSTGEKVAAAILYTIGFAVAVFAVIAIFAVSGFGPVSAIVGLCHAPSHIPASVALPVCSLIAAAMSLYCMVLIFRCVVDHFPGKGNDRR